MSELIADAQSFIGWASRIGVKQGKNNWLEKAVKKISDIASEPIEKQQKKFSEIYEKAVDSQHNASDLSHISFILENIGEQDEDILKMKLRKILKGADSTRQESFKNTEPRDTFFELSVCARLNERGFLAKLQEPNPDIFASITKTKQITLALECKRAFSQKSIDDKIHDAYKQLRDRESKAKANLKIACIDITRAFTNGHSHLYGDQDEVTKQLEAKLAEEAIRVEKLITYKKYEKMDAVILFYQDYIELTDPRVYRLAAITQSIVVINPIKVASRKNLISKTLKILNPRD